MPRNLEGARSLGRTRNIVALAHASTCLFAFELGMFVPRSIKLKLSRASFADFLNGRALSFEHKSPDLHVAEIICVP